MTGQDNTASYDAIRAICLEEGIDDAGMVEIARPALDEQRPGLLEFFPQTKTVLVLATALNRPSLRSTDRYLCSHECNTGLEELDHAGRRILKRLTRLGISGMATSPAFPMDFAKFLSPHRAPSHKILAQEAGLGLMGLSRLVLHPRLGSAMYLNSILLDKPLDRYSQPLDEEHSPCVDCRLCVAACPVGAIGAPDGFDHQACANHNYRELAPGFMDWLGAVVSSPDMTAYRQRFNDLESLSWWQSLAYKPGYKCNHCLAVCPAGSDVLPGYQADRKGFTRDVVRPLIDQAEAVYVKLGSRADEAVRANPAKLVRHIGAA